MPTPIPYGWHTLTPRLVVSGPPALVGFLKRAFGATGELRTDAPFELMIGGSRAPVRAAGPRAPMPAFHYLYTEDADATYPRHRSRRFLPRGAARPPLRRPPRHGPGPLRQHLADLHHQREVPLNEIQREVGNVAPQLDPLAEIGAAMPAGRGEVSPQP
jgi:hypothetical protein